MWSHLEVWERQTVFRLPKKPTSDTAFDRGLVLIQMSPFRPSFQRDSAMTELVKENLHPINAREAVLEAEQELSQTHLYCLQLMFWAVEEREDGLGNVYQRLVAEDWLNRLMRDPLDQVMTFLGFSGEEVSVQPEEIVLLPPVAAAQILLQALHRKLLTVIRTYQ